VKKIRVGVIYGGRSGEHEVSVASAAAIMKHLDRGRYEPVPIRIEKDGRWTLADKPPTSISAAEVIEHARLEAARPVRPGREAHLVAHPSEDTVLAIERRAGADIDAPAQVTGVGLDVVFTARTVRMAPFRDCWSLPTCRTSGRAYWGPRSAWTRR
jgi:D-alanine-D-alanine ligase